MTTVLYTTGDTGPALTGTVSADLTGATAVAHIKRADRTTLEKDVEITDPANGAWRVDWEDGDLNTAGVYLVEVEVTFSDSEVQTFGTSNGRRQVSFSVRRELDAP